MKNGGDVLARGAHSAQFAGASSDITQFENDFIYNNATEIMGKYGLTQEEYDQYQKLREIDGQHLPDLTPTAFKEDLGFSVTDVRRNYLSEPLKVEAVKDDKPKKFPEPEFDTFQPIMDRILVMRIADDPDTELLEDGSTRNRKTGLITAAKYRQHSNVGIVLATGNNVVLGGQYFDMGVFVHVGDKVTYGDYNSEVFPMDEKKVEALCDAVGINYVKDEQGLRIVRVQDVRGVERIKTKNYLNVSSFPYDPTKTTLGGLTNV